MKCYDAALKIRPDDLSVLVNKISSLRKQGHFTESLLICNTILKDNSKYNIALYHKERILFSMEKFNDSILCCNSILSDYPNNVDVLFDKSCNLAKLECYEESLNTLQHAIDINPQFRLKAKNNLAFIQIRKNIKFLKIVSNSI